MAKKVILASGSPRRKELLEQVGVEFEQRVSGKEERYTATEPKEIVKELALMKAENVASDIEAEKGLLIDTVVIGADTIVVLDGQILGKPRNEEHAFEMLQNLQGRSHEVYTGVAFLSYNKEGKKDFLQLLKENKLEFEDEALHAIAKKAKEKKVGARALRAIIEEFMLDIMYEIPKDDNIGKVIITKEYIEKTGGPVIMMRGCPELEEKSVI